VDAAIAALPPGAAGAPDDATLRGAVGGLMGQGVLRVPGRGAPPARTPPLLLGFMRRLVFSRVDLGDLAGAMPVAGPLLGWLFTPWGFAVWLLVGGLATAQWLARAPDVAESLRDLADFGALDAVQAFVVFTLVKLVHECGHAVAARRMAAAEGHRIGSFRWGFSFMFLMPAPYVDVTGIWFVGSKWRRALVGAAGVYVECLIAALAALAWAHSSPGWGQDVLFQTVLVVGVASVLFNLNPLVRLDGYYVLSDLLELPNLQQRAMAAMRAMLRAAAGLGPVPPRADWGFAAWQAASFAYRWVIYAGIFWLAFGLHWLLAAGVVLVVGVLFVAVPLIAGLRALLARPGRALLVAGAVGTATAGAALVPLPDHVVVQGVAEVAGVREVFAPADGMLVRLAPAGPVAADTLLLEIANPETLRTLEQLEREARAVAIDQRLAAAGDPSRLDALSARATALAGQAAQLRAEIAAWRVTAGTDGVWEPARALPLLGATLRRDDARPLGTLVPARAPVLFRMALDQRDGPEVLGRLDPSRPIPLRRRGGSAAEFSAVAEAARPEARPELPAAALAQENGGPIAARRDASGRLVPAERVFELRLRPDGPLPALTHGARVEARLALTDAPLAMQAWRRLQQALQRRLATQ
jgi:putative peptide zinc metalloprotease protein